METLDVGKKLVAFVQEGKGIQAVNELYADNIISVEAAEGTPEMPSTLEGIDAVRKKSDWWYANNEVHSAKATGPYPQGNRFAVYYDLDVTCKQSNQRIQMQEVGLYTVENGKITREEYFYQTS